MIFSTLLLAHLLADFVFQTDEAMLLKQRKWIPKFLNRGILLHCTIHFLTGLTLLWICGTMSLAVLCLLTCIVLAHYCIDFWKVSQAKTDLVNFLTDQALHLVIIYLLCWMWKVGHAPADLPALVISIWKHEKSISDWTRIVLVGSCSVCLVWVSGHLVGLILSKLKMRSRAEGQDNDQKDDRTGRHIGRLERILIGFFILSGNSSGLALLGTFKTLARFKQLEEDRVFTEYYIYGTLLSMVFGIGFSLVLNFLLHY